MHYRNAPRKLATLAVSAAAITLLPHPSAAQIVTREVNGWEYSEFTHPVDGTKSAWISKDAKAASGLNAMSFTFKCDKLGESPYAAILVKLPYGVSVDQVSLRFDGSEAKTVPVLHSNGPVVIEPTVLSTFVKDIRTAGQVAVGATASNASSVVDCVVGGGSIARCGGLQSSEMVGVINLRGSTAALNWLEQRCGSYAVAPPPAPLAPPPSAEVAELARKLKRDNLALVEIAIGKPVHDVISVAAPLIIRNQSDYCVGLSGVEYSSRFASFSSVHAVQFYQNGIAIGSDAFPFLRTAKDRDGLESPCLALPRSVADLGKIDLPDASTPQSKIMIRESGLKQLSIKSPYFDDVTFYLPPDKVELRPAFELYQVELQKNNGLYEYVVSEVDWLAKAAAMLASTNPAETTPQ